MTGASLLFDRNVDRWLQYQDSVKGRLRHDVILHYLEQHLNSIKGKLRVLDAGCGLGDIAVQLFDKVEKLVFLDFSVNMIEETKKRLASNYAALDREKASFVHGSVEESVSRMSQGSFDLILCHNILEYVENPGATMGGLVRILAPGGLLSVVIANCFSEPLRMALAKFDLEAARLAINARDSTADLFDNAPKHTFSLEELDGVIGDSELKVVARYGIRIFADYLPEALIQLPGNYRLLFELEKEAAPQVPYLNVARYLLAICQK
ncbi:MAG: methyltransferase domain-containing protein [Syntrophobacteraceae bacterium]